MDFQHAYSSPFRGSDLRCEDPSLTQQNWKDEVDINYLLERFRVTGQLPQGVRLPTYGDFTGISDYRSALDVLNSARHSFMAMPAEVRARFGNDPGAFMEFFSKEENRAEAERLGLVLPAKQDASIVNSVDSVLAAKPAEVSK